MLLPLLILLTMLPITPVQAAEQAPTTVVIASIVPAEPYIEQPIVVSVQVAAVNPADGIPTGNVEIKSGQSRVCLFPLDASGAGSCTLIYAAPATIALKAVYIGTDAYLPSTSPEVSLVVKNKYTPVVSLSNIFPNPSVTNRAVTALVTVTSTGPTPTGTVTVWRSDETCSAPPLDAAVDSCTLTLNSAGAGGCDITLTQAGDWYLCAVYLGDTAHFPAQAESKYQFVSDSNTFTSITAFIPSPILMGQPVNVLYQVTSPDGTPAPEDLVIVRSGTLSCTGTIADGSCPLTFTTPNHHEVTAEYQGNSIQLTQLNGVQPVTLQPSLSKPVWVYVTTPPTDIQLSNMTINRYAAATEAVALIAGVDPNSAETLTFSLAPGTGATHNALFIVSGNKLMLTGALDDRQSKVDIRLRATDPYGLTYEEAFTLRLSDVEVLIPETGFAAGRVTVLPAQPREKAYQAASGVQLEIPRLDVSVEVVGVPYTNQGWDTTWLWQRAGWLNGTAFPGWQGNSVLAAHNYVSDGTPGPFNRLQTLRWGDQILIHSYGETHVYEVRSVDVARPDQQSILKHEDAAWLTLVTCKSFDERTGTYRSRVVVRAVLVDIR